MSKDVAKVVYEVNGKTYTAEELEALATFYKKVTKENSRFVLIGKVVKTTPKAVFGSMKRLWKEIASKESDLQKAAVETKKEEEANKFLADLESQKEEYEKTDLGKYHYERLHKDISDRRDFFKENATKLQNRSPFFSIPGNLGRKAVETFNATKEKLGMKKEAVQKILDTRKAKQKVNEQVQETVQAFDKQLESIVNNSKELVEQEKPKTEKQPNVDDYFALQNAASLNKEEPTKEEVKEEPTVETEKTVEEENNKDVAEKTPEATKQENKMEQPKKEQKNNKENKAVAVSPKVEVPETGGVAKNEETVTTEKIIERVMVPVTEVVTNAVTEVVKEVVKEKDAQIQNLTNENQQLNTDVAKTNEKLDKTNQELSKTNEELDKERNARKKLEEKLDLYDQKFESMDNKLKSLQEQAEWANQVTDLLSQNPALKNQKTSEVVNEGPALEKN